MPTGVPSTRAIVKVTLTVVSLGALLYLVYVVRSVLLLVFISAFLAIAMGPAVDMFARRRVPRGLSILLVYLLILGGIVGVGLLVVPPIVSQVDGLSRDIPGYVDSARKSNTFRKYDDKYEISDKINEQARKLPQHLGDATGALQAITVGVFSALVELVTVLTMTFFFLLDGRRVVEFLLGATGTREARLRVVAGEIYKSVSGYVAGNVLISLIAGITTYIALTLLDVPFAVPLSVLMAFLDLIPLVGATIGGVTIGIVTLFTDFPTGTLVWLVVFVVYQQVENNVLQPVVYRRTVNVPPLAVIVAILIGSSLLGVLGALVAIPIAAAVQIVAKDAWRRRQDEPSLTHGDPLAPSLPPAEPAG